jgi:hypothetical protein
MKKHLDEIEEKRNDLTRKFNSEIYNISEGLKKLQIDEIPDAVRTVIIAEIEYSFDEKWKMYRKAMDKLDAEINDLKKYY